MNAYISETVRNRAGKLCDNSRVNKSVLQLSLDFRHAPFLRFKSNQISYGKRNFEARVFILVADE